MPTQTDKLQELRENTPDGELPYISKSRVTTYKTCPRKFFYSYIKGLKSPETFYMTRGTRIHRAVEIYYENVVAEFEETGEVNDNLIQYLPEDSERWADFIEPFITNFLLFEHRRLDAAPSPSDFIPVGIEAEGWDESYTPPMMGYADVILKASSVPEIDENDGVVVTDLKTGKTPDPKYRDEGIFLEGEYYSYLFKDEWDVTAVAGYYPKNDDFIVSDLDEDRLASIFKMIERMKVSREMEKFPTKPQPLCKWSDDDDDQCEFYDICPAGGWGKKGGPGPTYN